MLSAICKSAVRLMGGISYIGHMKPWMRQWKLWLTTGCVAVISLSILSTEQQEQTCFVYLRMLTLYHCYPQRKLLHHPERSVLLTDGNLWLAAASGAIAKSRRTMESMHTLAHKAGPTSTTCLLHVQDPGQRGVMYFRTVGANYLCVSNVVRMGAKVVASGVFCVAGNEEAILSVVLAIGVIDISLKCRRVKFGCVALAAISLFSACRVATNFISYLFFVYRAFQVSATPIIETVGNTHDFRHGAYFLMDRWVCVKKKQVCVKKKQCTQHAMCIHFIVLFYICLTTSALAMIFKRFKCHLGFYMRDICLHRLHLRLKSVAAALSAYHGLMCIMELRLGISCFFLSDISLKCRRLKFG